MSDSDLEEIKLDSDFDIVQKESPSYSSNSGRSWIGETFHDTKQAKVVTLTKEALTENTQNLKMTEETAITGTSQNNKRRLSSAPCQKIKHTSGKLLRNIVSAKPKYFHNHSKYSIENPIHPNCCEKENTVFDPISFHSTAFILSNKNGSSFTKDQEPICLKTVPSGDSCNKNVNDMYVNDKQICTADKTQKIFFPSLKTKDFVDRDSDFPIEISSCFSSEGSSNPFESAVFQENRFKYKRKKHSLTGKSGMNFHLHKSTHIDPEEKMSPRYKQREYKTATYNYYNTSDTYKIPCTVAHCGTQTDISLFAPRAIQILEPVTKRSVHNPWFMLHKATNTSNENCSILHTSNEHLNMTNVNFLQLKTRGKHEVASNGNSCNNLGKNIHNNAIEKCDQNMNQPCCWNGFFSRLFSCCF